MYATRQQTAAYDENKRAEGSAVFPKGASKACTRAPAAQANSRRALGDIGNLVGALSARCIVSKEGLQENTSAAVLQQVVDRAVTRRFGANLADNQLPLKTTVAVPLPESIDDPEPESIVENAISWGAKQRRTMGPSKCRGLTEKATEMSVETSDPADINRALPAANLASYVHPAAHPARLKDLTKCDAWGAAVKKQPALIATLPAQSEATCGGVEIEMQEAEETFPSSIDERDVGNQLAVVDYVEDIYDFYRKTEIQSCVALDYMSRQADINEKMRAILIDWLIEVHLKFKLMPETLFLTINLIDRYLACQSVLRKNLQLVGVTAMLVASKYEEIWAPEVQDFVFISDNAYTREQVLEMEKSMVNKLKFNLTVPTPYVFLVRFLKAAGADMQMEKLAFFFVELCLTEYVMVRFPPSLLAAAAVYSAHRTLQRSPAWTSVLQRHTGYAEMQLRDCAGMMVGFHRKAGFEGNVLTVVHKKYSNPKFNCVATLQPAVFSLKDRVPVPTTS